MKVCKFCRKEIKDGEPMECHAQYPPNTLGEPIDDGHGDKFRPWMGFNRFKDKPDDDHQPSYSHPACLRKEIGI